MGLWKILPQIGLTFDDILLVPGYGNLSRKDIDLSTLLSKRIKLSIPLVSAPMDTVTESQLAIELAKVGGIGIIHRNLTIEKQAAEVKKVKNRKLLVGAAIGVSSGFEDRVKALIAAGADGLRVGMGPGAICTTRIISGMGIPQITAIIEVCKIAKNKIPVIADGGIKQTGDMVKALAAGASTAMMGGFFAASLESPGKVITLKPNELPSRFKRISEAKKRYQFKVYRGMGSIGAMKKGAEIKSEDEFHGKNYKDKVLVAGGVEGLVSVKGKVVDIVNQAIGGIRSGMYYAGAKNISELWKKAKFIQITQASLTESHPHDIFVTNPGRNYL